MTGTSATHAPLVAHAPAPDQGVRGIVAQVRRAGAATLVLEFTLTGELERLALPGVLAQRRGARTDELWKHTCFEAFIAPAASAGYLELNFSPAGDWAAYRFSGYRAGQRPLELPEAPAIAVAHGAGRLELRARLGLDMAAGARGSTWRLGIAAVIEDAGGNLSYWAIRHAPGRADFHHADGLALELAAPEHTPVSDNT